MGFTTNAENLAAALGLTLATVERKTTIPILAFVLMESENGRVKITGTDLDCAISTRVDAQVKEPFGFCVPVKPLYELVRLMEGAVSLALKDGAVTILSEGAKHKVGMLPKDSFPEFLLATEEVASIDGALLGSMMSAALIAAETNPDGEERWKNIEMSARDGELSVTGINGPRIANATTPTDGEFYVLLPLRGANILAGFAEGSEAISLALSDNLLTARSNKGEASFKLSALKWPDWRKVMAPEYHHSIEIDPAVMLPALKRVMLACDGRLISKVNFQLTKNKAILTAQGPNREGREEVVISCPTLNGNDLEISIAGNQLMEFFRVSKGNALWQIPEGNPALLFQPKEPLAFGFQYVQATLRK